MRTRFYRPEIDGLRALAVLPVVFYHAGVQLFSGGFVGVDIFFVVSGFLITQIIMRHIDDQNFSIVQFYERRVRRIAPALAFVLSVTSALAIWLLLPDDLILFAKSLAATTLFSSNFLFWSEMGYFAELSEFKPLLHTWSLAVEEQFYIFYPIFLLLTCRYWRNGLILLLWLGFAASFLLSVWGTANTPGAAFYLAPTRAWELTLGALLALNAVPNIKHKNAREVLMLAGMLLIAWAVVGYTSRTPFPGFAALAPCLGAGLVIYANGSGVTRIGKMLSWKPIVAIGLISYSLYLWHWPLIVFAKYFAARRLTGLEVFEVISLSFLLAFISWKWVEQPFRRADGVFKRKGLFLAAGGVGLLMVFISAAIYYGDGFRSRFYESELQMLGQAKSHTRNILPCLNLSAQQVKEDELCIVGNKTDAAPSFLLWGDSHADAVMPAISEVASKNNAWGYYAFYVSCPPLLGVENRGKPKSHKCAEFNSAMIEKAGDLGVSDVILAAMWMIYPTGPIQNEGADTRLESDSRKAFERGLRASLNLLREANIRAWIFEQVPMAHHDVSKALAVGRRFGISVEEIEPAFKEHETKGEYVRNVFVRVVDNEHVFLIDPAAKMCNENTCQVIADNQSLYADHNHLSEFGALWLSDVFLPIFRETHDDLSTD